MESTDFRGLMEAYKAVYAPQEVDEATAMAKRGHDETKLRKRAGGGEAADRATALENQPTYGDSKKAKQRTDYARKQRGDFRKTTSSSPGLHGYAHKSNDPAVKAKQAARGAQRGALTPKERNQLNMGDESFDVFDLVLEFLQAEGFAETLEQAEWMMANVIDEEAIEIILGEEQLDEISDALVGRAVNARIARTGAAHDAEMRDRTPETMRTSARSGEKEASMKTAAANRRARMNKEEYVDEAQVANRDPEKYEREQSKKSAPVRGEKTPMPPRGDKRREDFEKWYAKNVR